MELSKAFGDTERVCDMATFQRQTEHQNTGQQSGTAWCTHIRKAFFLKD
jgi:hypothetical protein